MRTTLDPLIVVKEEPQGEYGDNSDFNTDNFCDGRDTDQLHEVNGGDLNNNLSDDGFKDEKCM